MKTIVEILPKLAVVDERAEALVRCADDPRVDRLSGGRADLA